MNFELFWQKKPESPTRKLPFLPRVGLYVDFAGYEICCKYVPLLETLANVYAQRGSRYQMLKTIRAQMDEIKFPLAQKVRVITTSFRSVF